MRSISTILSGFVLLAGLATPAAASSECGAAYTIRSGDSLGKVARRCGHTVEALLTANPEIKDPGRISVGQSIVLPGSTVSTVSTSAANGAAAPVETVLKGRIVAGRWCALIETAEGEIFGLASPRHSFRSETIVEVKGHVVGGKECGQDRTIAVSDLSTAGLTF
ncbi:MAG: LysM domain-containing protein [Pseudomonadota bacterium]